MAKRKETVMRVIDGDTFLTASRKRPVRLAGVDTPERGTRQGAKATQGLRKMIQGKKVVVHTIGRDMFGRTIARVKVTGKSVNKAVKNKLSK